jgi:hypothetical protein
VPSVRAERLAAGSEPIIELPDGTVLVGAGEATDTVLSDWLARPVRLVEAAGAALHPAGEWTCCSMPRRHPAFAAR